MPWRRSGAWCDVCVIKTVVKSLGMGVLEEREQLGGCCRNPGEGWWWPGCGPRL